MMPDFSTPPSRVLVLETSTDRMSVAVGNGQGKTLASHHGAGGSEVSTTLIPTVLALLAQVGWRLSDLDAIAYGCGPGAFTGLRSSCSVVQGLAYAGRPQGIPVVPVNTLLAVADEAGWLHRQAGGTDMPERIVAVLDARMDELYVASFAVAAAPGLLGPAQGWSLQPLDAPALCAPEALALPPGPKPWLVGNALAVYGERLPRDWQACVQIPAWPTAGAVLRQVPGLWAKGRVVDAAGAQPLYVRNKVALTTEERERAQADKQARALADAATPGGST